MLDLKAPSKADRKKLRLAPISRKDISRTNGSGEGSKADRRTHERKRLMGGGPAKTKVVKPKAAKGKQGKADVAADRPNQVSKKAAREVALDE